MATRMQQRRGTAAQWTGADPILAAGEIGFESDTAKFKIGDGVNHWDELVYYASATELANLIDGAPDLLNTLGELAAALGDDPDTITTILVDLGNKQDKVTNISDLEIGYLDGVTGGIQGQIDAKANTTTVNTALDGKQNVVTNVSDTEIGYLNGVTSAIQTQLDGKANATETTNAIAAKQTIVANVSDVEIGYLAGVTSSIQTQLGTKASTTELSNHESDTTNIHGITDTAQLATKTYADGIGTTATNALALKAPLADPTFTGTVSGVTKTHVGLGNVDNTADSAKPVSTAQQTALDAKLALAGGTMTGALTLSGAPTSDLHAATKLYVDGLAAGINFHQPVVAATTGNLAGTYDNGTSGLGATLTKASSGAIGTIDGATVSVGNRILLRAQTDAKENGIYVITAVGSVSAPWVITRAADGDNNPSGELATGDFTFVTSGSTNASKGFILSTTGTITIGTTEIAYTQFNASESVIAGTNIDKTGATISVVSAPTFSGAITASSGVVFSDGTQTLEGVPSRTPIIQKTASYTLSALTERDDLIEMASGSAMTLTIPADSTLDFPIGTSLDVLQTSTGQVTIAGAGGVTVNSTPGLKLRTTWSSATLFKRAANTWVVYGDLTA